MPAPLSAGRRPRPDAGRGASRCGSDQPAARAEAGAGPAPRTTHHQHDPPRPRRSVVGRAVDRRALPRAGSIRRTRPGRSRGGRRGPRRVGRARRRGKGDDRRRRQVVRARARRSDRIADGSPADLGATGIERADPQRAGRRPRRRPRDRARGGRPRTPRPVPGHRARRLPRDRQAVGLDHRPDGLSNRRARRPGMGHGDDPGRGRPAAGGRPGRRGDLVRRARAAGHLIVPVAGSKGRMVLVHPKVQSARRQLEESLLGRDASAGHARLERALPHPERPAPVGRGDRADLRRGSRGAADRQRRVRRATVRSSGASRRDGGPGRAAAGGETGRNVGTRGPGRGARGRTALDAGPANAALLAGGGGTVGRSLSPRR